MGRQLLERALLTDVRVVQLPTYTGLAFELLKVCLDCRELRGETRKWRETISK